MPDNNSIDAPLPIEVINGGTGADNAPDARDNLGITIGAATIQGTADEILVANGDASLGDPTISLGLNAILPGTGAATVPSGPTATRPGIPVNGMIRANTDTGETEVYTDGEWTNIGAHDIIGTPDEILVTNGDGVLGDPTIGIEQNPIIPGDGSITVPRGTTAARPGVPVNGMIRNNTDTDDTEFYTNGSWLPFPSPVTSFIPQNYFSGFTHDILTIAQVRFGPGACMDSTNTVGITLGTLFSKIITLAWSEGDGLGGLASSLVLAVNTVYYTFALTKLDGTVDYGFDTDVVATNLMVDATAAGFLYFRRIGSVRTQIGSSNLEVIFNQGDFFWYETPKQDFTVAYGAPGIFDNIAPLSIPALIPVTVNVSAATLFSGAGTESSLAYVMAFENPGITDAYSTHAVFSAAGGGGGATPISEGCANYHIPSSTGAIRVYAIASAAGFSATNIGTIGWTDRRGK